MVKFAVLSFPTLILGRFFINLSLVVIPATATAGTGLLPPDTDGDGIVDHSDLDSDNDTISDLIEGGSGAPDADDNGVADGPDADQDGIVDSADGIDGAFGDANDPAPTDTDGEGTADFRDPDSDDPFDNIIDNTDGTNDDIDAANNSPLDSDQDGLVDNPTDADQDGVADVVDGAIPVFGGLGAPEETTADLFPNFTFGNTTYSVGDERMIVININEILGDDTDGSNIQVFVPFSAGFTYEFDPAQTLATVIAPETVNNPDWSVTNTGTGFLFSTTNVIPGGGRSRIAIKVTANVASTVANITANIVPGSGGEIDNTNNISVLAKSIQD